MLARRLMKKAASSEYFSPAGYALWLKLNQTSGTTATDSGPNGYNATLINAPTWATDQVPCLSFNAAAGQYGNLGEVLDMGTSGLAVCGWIKTTTTGAYQMILEKSSSRDLAGRWYFTVDPDGKLVAFFENSFGNYAQCTSAAVVADGAWKFVGGIWTRGGSVQTYINGTTSGTPAGTMNVGTNYNISDLCYLGAYGDASGIAPASGLYNNGKMSNVQAWKSTAGMAANFADMFAANRGLYGV